MREFQRMQLMPWSRPGLDWQRPEDASERGSSRMMMPPKDGNPREPWLPWGTLINVVQCYIDKSWTVRTVKRSMFFDDFETYPYPHEHCSKPLDDPAAPEWGCPPATGAENQLHQFLRSRLSSAW